MSSRTNLYLAAAVSFLVLAILLGPWARRSVPSDTARGVPIPSGRARRPPAPVGSHQSRDFSKFAKHSDADDLPKFTSLQLEPYLEAQHRSAGSLVAAFRISWDEALLREAMEKFPHDPQVLLTSLHFADDPAKRLEILNAFQQVDPGNGLGYCLAARALFDLGKSEEALTKLEQASGKPVDDMTLVFTQNTEEAYLAAGLSPVEAKMTSLYKSTKTELIGFRNLADQLRELRKSDAAAGNDAAVQSSRDLQINMAREIQNGGFIVDSLVAMAVEKGVLREIDTQNSRDRMAEMDQQRKSMTDDSLKIPALMQDPSVLPSDWDLYFDRAKLFGEKAANEWILKKYPDR